MAPLNETLRAGTAAVEPLRVVFQELVMAWPPGSVKPRFQPLIALLPVLATVTFAVKPLLQVSVAYVTRQAELPPGGGLLGLLGGGELGVPLLTWAEKLVTARP